MPEWAGLRAGRRAEAGKMRRAERAGEAGSQRETSVSSGPGRGDGHQGLGSLGKDLAGSIAPPPPVGRLHWVPEAKTGLLGRGSGQVALGVLPELGR